MVSKLLDYSTWRPDVEDIKKLGAEGVVRYLSVVNDKTEAKIITKDGAQRLLDGGLSISLVYEWYVGRPVEGKAAGVADVKTAETQADSIGAPIDIPIFYAVDTDTTLPKVRAYFQAINETNKRPVGVYGSYQIVHGLMKEGLVTYGWQTAAWSNGKVCSHSHLYQNVFKNQYDLNDVLKPFPTWKKTVPVEKPDVEEPVVVPETKPSEATFVKPDKGDTKTWLKVNGRGAKVASGGYWVTTRGLAMYLEACRLYRFYGGGTPPAITQGGRNAGGVAQSAGTHDREAFDWSTKDLNSWQEDLWELCLWVVGFASWQREYIPGERGWPRHDHGIPKGGDLSRGAANQTVDFSAGRDGLVSRRTYSRIGTMGVNAWTWEKYLDNFTISIPALAEAAAKRVKRTDVTRLQWALSCKLRKDVVADGDFGPLTQAALKAVGTLGDEAMAKLGLPTVATEAPEDPTPPAPVWPKVTGEVPAKEYWVDAKKVQTELNGRSSTGEILKKREPNYRIFTGDAIVVGGNTVPASEGTNRWLKTESGVFYDLEYLTTEKPVTPPPPPPPPPAPKRTLKVATWNLYVNSSIAEQKKGLKALVDEGVCLIGTQELSEDANQRQLTDYMESLGFRATQRNSAVTSFYDPRILSGVKESHVVVEKGGRKWESGAGGNDSIYKIIMMLDGKVKADGTSISLLNHHLVPTVESGGKFRSDKPIRVEIYKKQIAAIQAQTKKRSGIVVVTADQNVAWGTPAGDWVMNEYDEVGLAVCWDEATDVNTHTSDRVIDWVAVKGAAIAEVEVLPYHGSDHKPVICAISY